MHECQGFKAGVGEVQDDLLRKKKLIIKQSIITLITTKNRRIVPFYKTKKMHCSALHQIALAA